MLNLLLFIVVIFVSFVVVRIGAIAFHLTGLDWSLAKFQALSCFSGTGFTTKESELIANHPQRRKIASILMVLGNAGIVTLVATTVNSLQPTEWVIPYLGTFPRWLQPWVSLVVIMGGLYGLYLFINSKAAYRLTDALERRIISRRQGGQNVSFEELTVSTGGYSVFRVQVCDGSEIVNKTLLESGLKSQNILVLAIKRGSDTMANPTVSTQIMERDELICFGQTDTIRNSALFCRK